MFGYIYKITNKVNGKIYIGKTQETAESRFKEHLRVAKRGKKQSYLHSAIKSYGNDSFIVEEIDQAESKEELCDKERYWISYYDSRNPDVGYNIGAGGEGGAIFSAKGKLTVNKDGHNTFIDKSELEYYLKNGWKRGGKKLGTNKCHGTVWINNGEIQKRIDPGDLSYWENNGWVLGYTEKAKDRLSESHLGLHYDGHECSQDTKEYLSKLWIGSKKMTNGNIVIQAKKDEIDEYLEKGFVFMSNKVGGGDANE